MKKIILFILILSSNLSFAQTLNRDDPNFCKMDNVIPEQSMQLARPPSWFISIHPEGDRVAVIHSNNNVYNFPKNGEAADVPYYRVPGGVDGVFSPDGWFITQPDSEEGGFYDFEKIEENVKNGILDNSNARLVGTAGVGSVYQSIGLLEKNSAQTEAKYMYIADPNGVSQGSPIEYAVVSAKRNPVTKEKSITGVKNGILCEGKFTEATTPMISRDGKYLSILNKETNTTQIYKVDADGLCEQVVDLGVPTGKVSFDFGTGNKRKLTFHVDQYQTNDGWFSQPGPSIVKNSFVMDLDIKPSSNAAGETWDIKNYTRLSDGREGGFGSYYPRFDKHGNIIAVNVTKKQNGIKQYSISRYSADRIENKRKNQYDYELMDPAITPQTCSNALKDKMNKLYALGAIFEKICMFNSQKPTRYKDAILISRTMDSKACKNLVETYWNTAKNTLKFDQSVVQNENIDRDLVLSYTHEDLMTICPEDGGTTGDDPAPVTYITTDTEEETGEEAFLRVCGGCHLPGDESVNTVFKKDGKLNTGDVYNNGKVYKGLNPYFILYGLDRVVNRDHYMQGHAMPPQNAMENSEQLKIEKFMLKQYVEQGGDLTDEDYLKFQARQHSH